MKKYAALLTVISAIALPNLTLAQPPLNLTCAKRHIVTYYESGLYEKEVAAIVSKAEKNLIKKITENNALRHPRKLAIVLDIDDTSLTNFPDHKKRDFNNSEEAIDASYRQADAPAIQPVLNLYNLAIKNGVEVFFVSFRPEAVRSYTITNLQKVGFYGWSGLYLANEKEVQLPPACYKTAVRKILTEKGYQIVLNLGDQVSDVEGGLADFTHLIPNPLYNTSPTACLAKLN
ncbi:MAG: acid phosphatase [Gammaproteobacteria bacterium]|nr:acid phosphatase [Gammaproteobacteria bacterium]